MVCDAGGSTIDTTAYNVQSSHPLMLHEVKVSACMCLVSSTTKTNPQTHIGVQTGGIFVNFAAEKHLRILFESADSSFDSEDIDEFVENGVKDFEMHVKRGFRDVNAEYRLNVGGRESDKGIRLKRGKLTLSGYAGILLTCTSV